MAMAPVETRPPALQSPGRATGDALARGRAHASTAASSARIGALLGGTLLLLPTLGFGLGHDHGFHHLFAWAALTGHWPYVEVWDGVFPGVFIAHAPAVLWGGGSALSLRLVDLAIQLAGLALIFETARRLSGPLAGILSGLAYAATYTLGGYYHTAQRDGFVVPLVFAALLALMVEGPAAPSRTRLRVAGTALGIACLIRPTYVALVVTSAVLLATQARRTTGSWRASARAVLAFGVPAVAPNVAFFAVYALAGHSQALADTILFLLTVYPELERARPAEIVTTFFLGAPKMLWIGAALALVTGRVFRLAPTVRWPLLFLGTCLAVRLIESKGYLYQFWPAWSLVAVLSGLGWAAVLEMVAAGSSRRPSVRTTMSVVTLGVIALVLTSRSLLSSLAEFPSALTAGLTAPLAEERLIAGSPGQAAVARYLRARLTDGARIQLWGPSPMVYYAARGLPASRFVVSTAFLCVDPERGEPHTAVMALSCRTGRSTTLQQRFAHEFLAALERDKPLYIVAAATPATLEITDGAAFAPDFPELRGLIRRDYERETTIERWAVYRVRAGR